MNNHFITTGRYFGYPECCISEFISYCSALDDLLNNKDMTNYNNLKESKISTQFLGTGYIPCGECSNKTREELVTQINSNRTDPELFPGDGIFYKDEVKIDSSHNHK